MYLMTNEIVVLIADLRYMTLDCTCGTSLTLDMTKVATTGEGFVAQDGITPAQCPFCKAAYDVSPDAINGFRNFYRSRINTKTNVSFRAGAPSTQI